MRTTLRIMTSAIHPYSIGYTPHNLLGTARSLLARMLAAAGSSPTPARQYDFEQLARQYSPLISRICFSFANKRNTIDDLRQDALLNIWRGLDSYRGESKLSTWIYRITLNTCVSSIRHFTPDAAPSLPLEALADLSDDNSESKEELEYLHWLISRLNPLDRSIMIMWLDELSYEEIAEISGLPRNSVAVRLHRAKEKLKSLFAKEINI